MSTTDSNTFRLNITSASGEPWVPLYTLPSAPGQVVKIAGDAVPTPTTVTYQGYDPTGSPFPTNVWGDVRPTEVGGSNSSNQMLWGGDSRTQFIHSFSPAGAIAIAGSGGHHGTINFGACVFDLTDARWKRVWTTEGNPGVDNITNEGPPPSLGGPPYADVRTGTKIHGCLNYEDDTIAAYVGGSSHLPSPGNVVGGCWYDPHWPTLGTTGQPNQFNNCPRVVDPKQQTWEISRTEPPTYNATTQPHGWRFPGEFNGLHNGRFDRDGYLAPSARFNPIPAGTLEPTQSELPGTGHVWDQFYELKPSEGGGPRGSIVAGHFQNISHVGVTSLSLSHRFDLHTGIWHKFSTNSAIAGPPNGPSSQPSAVAGCEDPVMRRAFIIAKYYGKDSGSKINYLNLNENPSAPMGTWRFFSVGTGGVGIATTTRTHNMVIDPDRRLLIISGDAAPYLWAFDLQTLGPEPNPTAGLGGFKLIPYDDIPGVQSGPPWSATPGSHLGGGNLVWRYCNANGKFYRVDPKFVGGGFQSAPPADKNYQIPVLQRLTPPPIIPTPRPNFYYTTEASSGRWTLDEMPLSMGLPVPSSQVGYAACGFSFFYWVPAIQCFVFCPTDHGALSGHPTIRRSVYLIKPY